MRCRQHARVGLGVTNVVSKCDLLMQWLLILEVLLLLLLLLQCDHLFFYFAKLVHLNSVFSRALCTCHLKRRGTNAH